MVDAADSAPKKNNPLQGLLGKIPKLDKPKPQTEPPTSAYLQRSITQRQFKKKSIINLKFILIMVLILVVALGGFAFYISSALNAINSAQSSTPVNLPKPGIHASLNEQDLLSYSNKYFFVPFALLSYNSRNVSRITVNASLFNYPVPTSIYVLNVSDECWQNYCGNTTGILNSMEQYLVQYNVISSKEGVLTISPSNVRFLPPNSILIVMDGLMPSDFFEQASNNTTVLDQLLNEHTSIIYIGKNFTQVVTHHGIAEPISEALPQGFIVPPYLSTIPRVLPKKGYVSSYYFRTPAFAFSEGKNYTALAYENVYNGSIVAFSNTPLSGWNSTNYEGHDLAKAVQQLFWLPKTAVGARTINLPSTKNSSGEIGLLLNSSSISLNQTYVGPANNGSVRIWVTANGTYYPYTSNNTYQYIIAKPQLYYNGSIGIASSVILNQSTPINFTLITGSQTPIKSSFQYIDLYDLNLTPVFTTELPELTNVSGNYTFYDSQTFLIAPGKGYILKMFDGTHLYSAAYFRIAPVNFTLVAANYSSDSFRFSVTTNKQPISNINYTVTLNNAYPQSGTVVNNFVSYMTPPHTPTLHGELNFTFDVYGGKSSTVTYYYVLPFGISPEYIEIAVVMAMMVVMIVFVRAPHKDEFYIDVPSLPEEKKTKITLKADDVVSVFDKLNASYRWKYMPLSKAEIRSAIATNLKSNNIPIGLTYRNVEKILDQLVVKKYLVSADDLYAPVQWLELSKHDIEYLATFKKLRLYLVTHGYIFTDLDTSTNGDIVATLHSERKYIIIYSKTSQFRKVPVYTGSTTYIAFLNSYKLEEFKNTLYNSTSAESEELKMYIAADLVRLMDVDNPEGLTS